MANALEWLGNMLASQRMAPRMPTLDEAAYRINAFAAGDPVSARGPGMGPIMAGPEDYLAGSFDAITPGIPVNALTPLVPGMISRRGARRAMSAPRLAPQDNALAIAQRNAALPVENGGLGLPPNNTAMDRARAMGWVRADDDYYGGMHRPPMSDSGAPLHDLTGGGTIYPDDVYSKNAARYYGVGDQEADSALFRKIHDLKGKPDASVRVFRAVPTDVMNKYGNRIHHGDWVTISRNYAKEHGESALGGNYKIQETNVPAKSLFTNGDSPYEYGLDLSQVSSEGPASIPLMRGTGFNQADRSRFAAFDPFRRNESDLLAGIMPWAVPAGNALLLYQLAAERDNEGI